MMAEVSPDGYRPMDDLERRTSSAESPRERIRHDGLRKKGRRYRR